MGEGGRERVRLSESHSYAINCGEMLILTYIARKNDRPDKHVRYESFRGARLLNLLAPRVNHLPATFISLSGWHPLLGHARPEEETWKSRRMIRGFGDT